MTLKAPAWQAFRDLLDQSAELTQGSVTYRIANAAALELDAPDRGGATIGQHAGKFWEVALPAAALPPDVSPKPRDIVSVSGGPTLRVEQATRFGQLWRVRCVELGAARR